MNLTSHDIIINKERGRISAFFMKGGLLMISYNIILNVASDIVKKRRENGIIISSDDTVCVLCTNTGNIYTGISGLETRNGLTSIFHAEVDAVNNMKQHGESIIESVSVFSSVSLSPILPCNSCLTMMVYLAPENINTVIVTPTGNIKVTDIGMFTQPTMQPQYYQPYGQMMNSSAYGMPNQNFPAYMNSQIPGSVPMSSYPAFSGTPAVNQPQMVQPANIPSKNDSSFIPKAQENAGGDLLKNKLNGLLGDDDDDAASEELSDNKKKRRGLFR